MFEGHDTTASSKMAGSTLKYMPCTFLLPLSHAALLSPPSSSSLLCSCSVFPSVPPSPLFSSSPPPTLISLSSPHLQALHGCCTTLQSTLSTRRNADKRLMPFLTKRKFSNGGLIITYWVSLSVLVISTCIILWKKVK